MAEIIFFQSLEATTPEEHINDLFAKLTNVPVTKVRCSNQDQASVHFGELPFLFYGDKFVPRCQILAFWIASSTTDDFLTPEDLILARTIADLLQTRLSVVYVSFNAHNYSLAIDFKAGE